MGIIQMICQFALCVQLLSFIIRIFKALSSNDSLKHFALAEMFKIHILTTLIWFDVLVCIMLQNSRSQEHLAKN